MQDGIPHEDCGAKTRRGTPCKSPAMPNGRCRMHGGKSPAWFAHPRYKHGLYSKYSPAGIARRARIEARRRSRALWREVRAECDRRGVQTFGGVLTVFRRCARRSGANEKT